MRTGGAEETELTNGGECAGESVGTGPAGNA